MGITVRHVHSGLGEFRRTRPQKARAIMDRGAVVILETQKRLCRVKTGALVGTIHIEQRGTFAVAVVEGTETINYGWYLNKGTSRGISADHHIDSAIIAGLRYIDEALHELAGDVD